MANFQINDLSFYLKKLEKEEQFKVKRSTRKKKEQKSIKQKIYKQNN